MDEELVYRQKQLSPTLSQNNFGKTRKGRVEGRAKQNINQPHPVYNQNVKRPVTQSLKDTQTRQEIKHTFEPKIINIDKTDRIN